MASPPELDGVVQFRLTEPLPGVAVRFVGAPGGVAAIGEAVTVTVEVAVRAGDELSVTVRVAV